MDSLHLQLATLSTESTLTTLVRTVVLTHLAKYFCVCLIRSKDDKINFNIRRTSIVITIDSNFDRIFHEGIDLGCQAFIVQNQAIWPFLDAFIPIHDVSEQRFSGKRLIVVLDSLDVEFDERLCQHPAMRVIPDVLIILSQNIDNIELFTTRIVSKGFHALLSVQIETVTPPDFFPEKSKNLEGIPIRFHTVMYPPYSYFETTTVEKANAWHFSQKDNEAVPMFIDGQESLLLIEFCHRYNCSFEVFFDDDMWGEVFEDQTGTGSLGAVAMHNADITMGAIYYLLDLYTFTTFTSSLSRSGLTVVVPKPRVLAPWQTPFLTFSSHLWMSVAASFVVGVSFFWIVEKARFKMFPNQTEPPKSFSDAALMLIGLFIEQTVDTRRRDLASGSLLFVSMLFAGFMIGNLYTAGLAGIMTIPQYAKSIDSIRDMATSGLPWGGTAAAWIFAISTAKEELLQTIVSNFQTVDQETLTKYAKFGNFGFVGERTEFGHFVPIDYLDEESSQMLRLLREDLSWEHCTAVVSKTCPFKTRLDELIMNVRQSGVQIHWEFMAANKYLNMAHEKRILNGRQAITKEKAKQLTVLHFLGALLILGSGFIGGSVVLALEIAYATYLKFAR